MYLLGKHITALEGADLRRLIEGGIVEGTTLEFKEMLPGTSDRDKKEFLADISSFANTAGGIILYGVSEGSSSGEAEEVNGIQYHGSFDDERLRVESLVRDGLQPALSDLVICEIAEEGKLILAIGVQRSLNAPHAVWFKRSGRFYRRAGGGKYQVEVAELKRLFLEAAAWEQEATEYRNSRIERLLRHRIGPVIAPRDAALFLHFLPLGRLQESLNLENIDYDYNRTPPLKGLSSWGHRVNLDGYIVANWSTHEQATYIAYLRNGGLESYANLSQMYWIDRPEDGSNLISIEGGAFCRDLREHVEGLLPWFQACGVEGPLAVSLSLLGVEGFAMSFNPPGRVSQCRPIDREEIVIQSVVSDVRSEMQAALDELIARVWQASGWKTSPLPEL